MIPNKINETLHALFWAWLIAERKALRLPGVMTSTEEKMLEMAFREGFYARLDMEDE